LASGQAASDFRRKGPPAVRRPRFGTSFKAAHKRASTAALPYLSPRTRFRPGGGRLARGAACRGGQSRTRGPFLPVEAPQARCWSTSGLQTAAGAGLARDVCAGGLEAPQRQGVPTRYLQMARACPWPGRSGTAEGARSGRPERGPRWSTNPPRGQIGAAEPVPFYLGAVPSRCSRAARESRLNAYVVLSLAVGHPVPEEARELQLGSRRPFDGDSQRGGGPVPPSVAVWPLSTAGRRTPRRPSHGRTLALPQAGPSNGPLREHRKAGRPRDRPRPPDSLCGQRPRPSLQPSVIGTPRWTRRMSAASFARSPKRPASGTRLGTGGDLRHTFVFPDVRRDGVPPSRRSPAWAGHKPQPPPQNFAYRHELACPVITQPALRWMDRILNLRG